MLTTSDIREIVDYRDFLKGQKLQMFKTVKDFEYSIYNNEETTVADLSGVVEDGEENYRVSVVLDEDYDDIAESKCTCEEFLFSDGRCSHCIALILEYLEKRRTKEVLDVKWKMVENIRNGFSQDTDFALKTILDRYAMRETSKYLIPERNSVELVPRFTIYGNRSMEIEFKIGITQKYVLKNISAFLQSIQEAERVKYGKKLDFYHNIEAFTPKAVTYIEFLKEQENQRRTRYRDPYDPYDFYRRDTIERMLDLNESGMEKFFEMMKGEYLEGTIPILEDTVWYVEPKEKIPSLKIKGDEKGALVILERSILMKGNTRYYFFEEGTIYASRQSLKENAGDFFEYLANEELQRSYIAAAELAVFCRDLLPILRQEFELEYENFDENLYLPEKPKFELYVDKLEHNVVAGKVMVIYPQKKYNLLEKEDFTTQRNVEEEMRVKGMIEGYFNAVDAKGELFLIQKDEELLYQLLSGGLQRLNSYMTIYASDAFQNMKVHSSPNVSVGIHLKSDLLELSIQSEEIPLDELFDLLNRYDRKKHFIRLKNGDFMNINKDDGLEVLAEMKEDLRLTEKNMKDGQTYVPAYRAMYLEGTLKNRKELQVEKNKEFKSMVRGMKTIEDSDYEVPKSLNKIMREYQKNGFRWLKTLRTYGFGGILADDMGLGKTLQVISLLLSEQETEKEEKRPSIVICPASLVYNWKREIERFAPSLTPVVISGSVSERKAQIKDIKENEIVITSYDLLKRDVKEYAGKRFDVQVIDEAQYIKNPTTQAAKGVKKINAGFKLALTGTPIENRLSELWSIFDYLMPGFLYTYAKFRDEIELPIVAAGDENKTERLQRMIRPFVLRRLKTDVLKDLPEKLEENVYSKLEGEQLALYDAHVQRMKMVLDKQSDKEFVSGRFELLAELTKLRQICCDPSLVFEGYQGESAKLQTCMELITNAVNGGHKILLFSQFTTMLEHIQEKLEEAGISYYTLTGSVNKEKRLQLVEKFNKDDTNVFCISLKAGGTGLNLTSADIVIHYDPWWNVAVQNQATDRAHRIGQQNVVTVYKLVSQGTIEEKIIEIQEKKKELANEVLGGKGIDSARFSREEMLELLG